jgi:pyrophosphatase PpaX
MHHLQIGGEQSSPLAGDLGRGRVQEPRYLGSSVLYAGIDRLLRDLSGAGVAVAAATSKRRASAEIAAGLTGLSSHLDVLVTMEDTVVHKPDPEPLLLAVNRLGATPDQAVYVGDAIVDVQAARNAGMAAVAVTWGAGVRAALEAMGPDVVAETVDDLREALRPSRTGVAGA